MPIRVQQKIFQQVSPFGRTRRTIEHLEFLLIYLKHGRMKKLSGNREADFNGHIFMTAAF